MGWERRRGAHYFYRHVRVGGCPRRDYYGRGPAAELAARLLAEARAARAAEAGALREAARAFGPLDRVAGDLDAACRRLTEAGLGAAGHRRTADYEWSRVRGTDRSPTPV
jgi:hypothetical protein